MTDLSMVGGMRNGKRKASIKMTAAKGGPSVELYLDDLGDGGDPIRIDNLEIVGSIPDLNGDFMYYQKRNPIRLSLTFLPGSKSDIGLMNFLYAINSSETGKSILIDNAVFTYPGGATVTYSNGAMISGTPGIGCNSEGRMTNKTYSFSFSSFSVKLPQ